MISPATLKLLAANKIDTQGWQPPELEYFQDRYAELSKEYVSKLQEPDADGMKAALALAVLETDLQMHEDAQSDAGRKLIAALEVLCNERLKAKGELDTVTAKIMAEKIKAEKEFKDKAGRRLCNVQTLSLTDKPVFALKYGDEVASAPPVDTYTADAIQAHLDSIPSLKGNVTVSGPVTNSVGQMVFEIKFAGKLKRNFTPLIVASGDGVGTISLGY